MEQDENSNCPPDDDHNKVILHEFVQSEITKGSLPLATKIERAAVAKPKPFEFSRFVCFGCT